MNKPVINYSLIVSGPNGLVIYENTFDSPMDSMSAFVQYTKDMGGYGAINKVECYRYVNNFAAERQWLITID
jgi:hypothetical protein